MYEVQFGAKNMQFHCIVREKWIWQILYFLFFCSSCHNDGSENGPKILFFLLKYVFLSESLLNYYFWTIILKILIVKSKNMNFLMWHKLSFLQKSSFSKNYFAFKNLYFLLFFLQDRKFIIIIYHNCCF